MVRILNEGEPACESVKAEVEALMRNYPLYA